MFAKCASFRGATFAAGIADFSGASFQGETLFAPGKGKSQLPIFSGVEVDFREVIIEPLDALTFRDADLQKCKFQGTDLRKAEITGVRWTKIADRSGLYNEVAPLQEVKRAWSHIERVSRELKQNYEDRRDYERAGDFHYGEKDARRKNPDTSRELRFWLWLYKYVGGYGERWRYPLLWAGFVLVASTLCYLTCGLLRVNKTDSLVDLTRMWETGIYSLKVMTLLKPINFEPVGL